MISEESGSIIPFGLGIISLTAVIALVLVELIGVQYQTLQNKQLADVLVLKVAKDLKADGIAPIVGLDFRPVVSEMLHASSSHLRVGVADLSVGSRDGKTIEALVCSEWVSITGFSLGSFGQVCANSKARAIS
jgi:hypothetical protein